MQSRAAGLPGSVLLLVLSVAHPDCAASRSVAPENYVVCSFPFEQEAFVEGHFVSPGERTRLYLRSRPVNGADPDSYRCVLQHQEGRTVGFGGDDDIVHLRGICRDPLTGLDLAVLSLKTYLDHAAPFRSNGPRPGIAFWSVDPRSRTPRLVYGGPFDDLDGRLALGADPNVIVYRHCWHADLRADEQRFLTAMAELSAAPGPRVDDVRTRARRWNVGAGAAIRFPYRELPSAEVTRWLSLLAAMEPPLVTFETARYADARAVTNWWVLQVLGTKLENAPGVVLLFDRASRRWLSLYDVFSGSRGALNYPLESMVLRGETNCLRAVASAARAQGATAPFALT